MQCLVLIRHVGPGGGKGDGVGSRIKWLPPSLPPQKSTHPMSVDLLPIYCHNTDMDWHDCSTCGKRHPWRDGTKPCPIIQAKAKPERETGHAAGVVIPSGKPLVSRLGRPRIEDRSKTFAATKPWEKLGMSERSWYRRRAKTVDKPPQ